MAGKKTADSVTVRDLVNEPIPAIDGEILAAFGPSDTKTEQQQAHLDLSNTLIEEIKTHDVIVIAAPMYNFTIPSQLKNYFDFIARSGHTFKYTPADTMVPYLSLFLNFIGITDIEFIFAEGTALGADSVAQAHQQAQNHINSVIA